MLQLILHDLIDDATSVLPLAVFRLKDSVEETIQRNERMIHPSLVKPVANKLP